MNNSTVNTNKKPSSRFNVKQVTDDEHKNPKININKITQVSKVSKVHSSSSRYIKSVI